MNQLTLDAYQTGALTTAMYPHCGEGNLRALSYVGLKLAGEVGEIQGVVLDIGCLPDPLHTKMHMLRAIKEAGDVLWYMASAGHELGQPLSAVMDDLRLPRCERSVQDRTFEDLRLSVVPRLSGLRGGLAPLTHRMGDLVVKATRFIELVGKGIRDDGDSKAQLLPARALDLQEHHRKTVYAWVMLCHQLGLDLAVVAQANLDKLASRKARGTLGGSGDDR